MSRISFELENISEIRSAILLLFAFYKTEGHTFQVILQTEHHLFINLFILFLNVHSKIIYFVTSRCSSSPIYEEEKKKKNSIPSWGMHCNCNKVILILVNSPKDVILIGLFSGIIFSIIYEFDPHILHVLRCVMWLYLDKESVILGSCFERFGASCFYWEHQDPYK